LDWTSHYNGKSKGASIAAETSGPSNGVRMAESSKARIVSVDEYLVIAGGWSIFQNRLFAAMSLLYMCVSFDMFLAVFLAPTLGAQWGLTIPQQGLIASSWFVGGLIGYVLSGLFADTLGRRPTLLALSVLRCFGDCFTFASASLPWLLASRILAAVGTTGAFNMTYPLLAEFSPPEQRAEIKTATSIVFQSGIVALVVVSYLLRSFPWQTLSLALVPASLLAAMWLFYRIPESPRFLSLRGRQEEALSILRDVASCNGRLQECDHLRLSTTSNEDIEDSRRGRANPRGSVGALLARGQSGRTIALLVFHLVASCTYYGLTFAPVASFGNDAYLSQLAAPLLETLPLLLIAPLANKHGRRPAMIGPLVVFAAANLALATMSNSATQWRLTAVLAGRMSGCTLNTVKWVVTAENFPTAIRGAGFAAGGLAGMLGANLGPLIFMYAPSPFLVLSSLCLLGVVAIWALPETKGKELD